MGSYFSKKRLYYIIPKSIDISHYGENRRSFSSFFLFSQFGIVKIIAINSEQHSSINYGSLNSLCDCLMSIELPLAGVGCSKDRFILIIN